MKRLKAIVVEDERLPRLSLIQKLADFKTQIEVVGSCEGYDEALETILRLRPDVLFLDIQLQGKDSIQLLNTLKQTISLPQVIFTTAYEDRKYLMEAIKLSAVDYLLKPIDRNELAIAIAKLTERKSVAQEEVKEVPVTGKLTFRTYNGRFCVEANDVAYICADGNNSKVVMFDSQETVLDNLLKLEEQLDGRQFVRVDRKHIVNIRNVYKLNTKRHLCMLRSLSGVIVELELSKNGFTTLLNLV